MIQNNSLHHEALKTLCALQQYMSTLFQQDENSRRINYYLSFKLMKEIVNILYSTLIIEEYDKYPLELTLIQNQINSINKMLK